MLGADADPPARRPVAAQSPVATLAAAARSGWKLSVRGAAGVPGERDMRRARDMEGAAGLEGATGVVSASRSPWVSRRKAFCCITSSSVCSSLVVL